jgi:PAS domain S-box-containing protein
MLYVRSRTVDDFFSKRTVPPRKRAPMREKLRRRRAVKVSQAIVPPGAGIAPPVATHCSPAASLRPQTRIPLPKRQHRFQSLVRKFHEFIVEFDSDWRIMSIWSSNFALPVEFRQNLAGKHFRELAGDQNFQYLRRNFHRALRAPSTSPATIDFSATVDGKLRWFEGNLSCLASAPGRSSRSILRILDVSKQHSMELRLRNCETLLEHAEETAEMGTWEFDLAARTSTWSKQLYRLHNLQPLNRPLSEEEIWRIINFKNRRQLRRDFSLTLRKGLPFRYTESQPQPDGSVRVLVGLGAPVFDTNGKVTRVVGVTRDITSQIRTQSDLRSLSQQLLTVRSEEQRRMGRDLHETTSQTLAALKMTLAQIGRSVPANNRKVLKLLRSSTDLASAALHEVRLVSSLLHPPLLKEAGLRSALRSYAKLFSDRSGISVTLRIDRDVGRLNTELELTVYRIIQEALTNVHRHAHATTVTVRVERSHNTLFVAIKDNGVGAPDSRAQSCAKIPPGVGIAGMRERIEQLHGQFKFMSSVGKGAIVCVSIPIPRSEEPPNEPKGNAERSRRVKALPYSDRGRSCHRTQRNSRAARAGTGHRSVPRGGERSRSSRIRQET